MNAPNLTVFTPAGHQDVLAILLQFAVLLFAARAFGEIAQRLRQPSVVGEILAGIVLGPSLIAHFFPAVKGYIVPGNPVQGYLLETISLMGAIFLLAVVGMHTDVKLIRRHARTALGVSFGGILVTFISGFFLGQYLPETLLADPGERLVFSLFIATAMSISAILVIGKVLNDLNLMRRDVGQTILAAGMSDDTVGWILLSIVASLAAGEQVSAGTVASSVGRVVFFLVFSFTAGRWLAKRAFDFVQDRAVSKDRLLTMVVVLIFFWSSFSQLLHLEAVLGAFVMGIIFSQIPRLPEAVPRRLERVALSIFSPIFFATAGLKVNIQSLLRPDLLAMTALVIAVATGGKVIGTYLGARLIGGRDHWTALSFGSALNARGAMEIIVATVGLSLGILSEEMFSIIVVMAMATSLMAPSCLRWVMKRVPLSEEEARRLKHESFARGSRILNVHRVLLPIRFRENDQHLEAMQLMKSKLLHNIGLRNKLSVTLFSVGPESARANSRAFFQSVSAAFKEHELIEKAVDGTDVAREIIRECKKDYELLVLGASKQREKSKYVFSQVIDDLIRLSPCASIVVHANNIPDNWSPRKILVPTNGSIAARNAAELAFMIASTGEETVKILNVIERRSKNLYDHLDDENFRRRLKVAADILKPLGQLGELKGVRTDIDAIPGPSVRKTIIDVAQSEEADLIIIGTNIHPASDNLFLGPQVEYILENAECPVITLNSL